MKKRKAAVILVLSIILAATFFRDSWLPALAEHLAIQENATPSDVIIVLGGERKGERTERAVKLYKEGYAPQLLFSDGTDLSWRIRSVNEMTALAKQLGVPEASIYIEDRSRSTYENALFTKQILLDKGWKSAIIVTTNWHSRRTKMVFEKVFEGSGVQLSYAAAADKVHNSLDKWWKDPEKQQTVLTEWAKLIVYWIKYLM
ncbi:YdcF family protein [Effusibacillus lacus]|uniref:DUF218 domain-containing protein n=1 Tax=Effusibacillus lacus TaxID=1348429 RepID=A0A292YT15_9BACL|nr:YdcF family protein [Effusibacillus lacus]GAX92051.1 hypothetical protein EFBL_3742 [Effusibacillus lacus]